MTGIDVAIWLVAAAALYFGGSRVLARFSAWLHAHRVAREARHDRTEQVLRDMFEATGAPIESVDRDWDSREVHGMTVPELMETRAQFNELIGREWPDKT